MPTSACPHVIRMSQVSFTRQFISLLDQLSVMNSESNYKREKRDGNHATPDKVVESLRC
jgi:hypothetical protein